MTETPETLAKVAYDAYCVDVGGKAFNGDDLPQFDAVPERIQRAWVVAVTAVVDRLQEGKARWASRSPSRPSCCGRWSTRTTAGWTTTAAARPTAICRWSGDSCARTRRRSSYWPAPSRSRRGE